MSLTCFYHITFWMENVDKVDLCFEDIDNYTSWSEAVTGRIIRIKKWLCMRYEWFRRTNLILTYINSGITPDNDIMDHCADEVAQIRKNNRCKLVSGLKPYGLVDDSGDVLFLL